MILKIHIGILFFFMLIGCSQQSDWRLKDEVDEFDNSTGNSIVYGVFYNELGQYPTEISFQERKDRALLMSIQTDFLPEITDRVAYLSIIIQSDTFKIPRQGYYFGGTNPVIYIDAYDDILGSFKESSEFKLALKLEEYDPIYIEVNCIGFKKTFNKMIFYNKISNIF